MSHLNTLKMGKRMRTRAEAIPRHGLTSFFEGTFACLQNGQVSKEPSGSAAKSKRSKGPAHDAK